MNINSPFLIHGTCRELLKLQKEVETLQNQSKECHSSLEKSGETLKQGLKATMGRLDQFLSHQKKDHAQVQEMRGDLNLVRDELAAWAVHFQQTEARNGITIRETARGPATNSSPNHSSD